MGVSSSEKASCSTWRISAERKQVVPTKSRAVLLFHFRPAPLHPAQAGHLQRQEEPEDLTGVFRCLRHYLEDDERRYGVEHQGEGMPYRSPAVAARRPIGRRFLEEWLLRTVAGVLDRFGDTGADVIGMVAREQPRYFD